MIIKHLWIGGDVVLRAGATRGGIGLFYRLGPSGRFGRDRLANQFVQVDRIRCPRARRPFCARERRCCSDKRFHIAFADFLCSKFISPKIFRRKFNSLKKIVERSPKFQKLFFDLFSISRKASLLWSRDLVHNSSVAAWIDSVDAIGSFDGSTAIVGVAWARIVGSGETADRHHRPTAEFTTDIPSNSAPRARRTKRRHRSDAEESGKGCHTASDRHRRLSAILGSHLAQSGCSGNEFNILTALIRDQHRGLQIFNRPIHRDYKLCQTSIQTLS